MKIAVIDYDLGNVRSISNAFKNQGADVFVTNDRDQILQSDGVILPGVGAFKYGMERLNEHGLVTIIEEYVSTGKPFMGICLGMQMLFDKSNEYGQSKGLSLIPGQVYSLPVSNTGSEKLPHVAWSELRCNNNEWVDTILHGLGSGTDVYFVHSFAAHPEDESHILSTTKYSEWDFCSSVKKDNIYGCQFHPEKSGKDGLKIIANFIRICSK